MKNINIESENHAAEDLRIAEMLRSQLPDARENQWFTRRVVNRLPEKKHYGRLSLIQLICYLAGVSAFIVAVIYSGRMLVSSQFSLISILSILSVSMLIMICGAVILTPALVRILRD